MKPCLKCQIRIRIERTGFDWSKSVIAIHVPKATGKNGLLNIELVRELPEEMKPREIEIETGTPGKLIEGDKQGIVA